MNKIKKLNNLIKDLDLARLLCKVQEIKALLDIEITKDTSSIKGVCILSVGLAKILEEVIRYLQAFNARK